MPAERRTAHTQRIVAVLERSLTHQRGAVIGVYWPIGSEPDLHPLYERLFDRGFTLTLPVMIAPARPLLFRQWKRGAPLKHGIWNIPTPRAATVHLIPDIIIAPVVGFDAQCHRLGHGGGYFDRTLAAFHHRPRYWGVGYSQAALPSIRPQWHDIPLDQMITDDGVTKPARQ